MITYITFFIELGLCLAISFSVIILFRYQLRSVLMELCGTKQRVDFWVTFTCAMLIIAPLMFVVFMTKTGETAAINHLVLFKETLFRSLLGVFIGLLVVAQVLWRSINEHNRLLPRPDTTQQSKA